MSDRRIQLTPARLAAVRDAALDKAIAERRIPPDRRGHYEVEFARAPQSTLELLASLEPAPQELEAVIAQADFTDPNVESDEAYPTGWLNGSERRAIRAAEAGEDAERVVLER